MIKPRLFSRRSKASMAKTDKTILQIARSLEGILMSVNRLSSCVTQGSSSHTNGNLQRIRTGHWND